MSTEKQLYWLSPMSLTLAICLAFVTHAAAQEGTSGTSAPKTLLQQAHELSESAQDLPGFTKIIELCQQAQQGDVSPKLNDYANQLSSWAYNRRGEWYADQGAAAARSGQADEAKRNDTLALEQFEAAIQKKPDYWKAIHNRGVSKALNREFDGAEEDFSRVTQLMPSYANAWFNRGEIRYELGKFDQAIEDYSETLRRSPDDADVHLHRGHAYFQLLRFREALVDYSRAVELAPEDAEALTNRGDAYRHLQLWAQAAVDYRKATQLGGDLARSYQSAAWLMATCPNARYRNDKIAVQAAEKAIELAEGDDFRYPDTMAAALANTGKFDQAMEWQAKAIKIAPKEQLPALQRRLQLYETGQPYREQTQPSP